MKLKLFWLIMLLVALTMSVGCSLLSPATEVEPAEVEQPEPTSEPAPVLMESVQNFGIPDNADYVSPLSKRVIIVKEDGSVIVLIDVVGVNRITFKEGVEGAGIPQNQIKIMGTVVSMYKLFGEPGCQNVDLEVELLDGAVEATNFDVCP